MDLDAVVVTGELSRVKIAGLTAGERAVRVARRVGATRIQVVESAALRELAAWRGDRAVPLLVIRADQLVHTPLVAPLVEHIAKLVDGDAASAAPASSAAPPSSAARAASLAIAVGADDAYAGALLATGAAADNVIAALARGDGDASLAATATHRVPHGEIARHAIATPDERRAAHRLLYRILIKPQDNAITRYLYRPVSFPLTRLLVWTPITPNQVSYLVALLVAIGCWLTARASYSYAILGTAIVLAASYLDCCDGEIARVKLLSSKLGAWLDTIVDEASTIGYMVAIGWHCHLVYGPRYVRGLGEALSVDPWIAAIAIGVATYGWSVYCIYYNIIVVVGSANSQDYVGSVEIAPGSSPRAVRLKPAAAKAIAPKRPLPPWLQWLATYAPYVIRRDFISWITLVFAILHWTQVSFLLFFLGGVVTSIIVSIDHIKLRQLQRSIARRGLILEPAA